MMTGEFNSPDSVGGAGLECRRELGRWAANRSPVGRLLVSRLYPRQDPRPRRHWLQLEFGGKIERASLLRLAPSFQEALAQFLCGKSAIRLRQDLFCGAGSYNFQVLQVVVPSRIHIESNRSFAVLDGQGADLHARVEIAPREIQRAQPFEVGLDTLFAERLM